MQKNRLVQLYTIINGYTPGAQISAIYLPQTIITRCYHHSRFVLPAANTTSYQANFFYCTIIKDWNDLPLNFYSIPTLSSFINSTISAHINGCYNTYNIQLVQGCNQFSVFPLFIIIIIIITKR